ncbi:citrate lyase alpha chain [Anaeramoeba flamelloides]|uniref:Citrate lyase alpha chain n=1 Tax=Anaeramoeba flamelloides TaxID=1746091 RepID=A0AAV7Z171_9EUKA|nr:citrate lyase alpha chain [Anaeramoeba flamelloides]
MTQEKETKKKIEIIENSLGRKFPSYIEGYGEVIPFQGAWSGLHLKKGASRISLGTESRTQNKMCATLAEALKKCKVFNGMTVSFHHHLREGDGIVNMTMKTLKEMGVKGIKLAPSALFNVHSGLVDYLSDGTIETILGSMNGSIGVQVSLGKMQGVGVLRSHGGRVRSIMQNDMHIDLAVIGAPTADNYGNANGIDGKSACGPLAYSNIDSKLADKVIIVTDNLVPYPASPISISQVNVDYVVEVESIGDPNKIVSGSLRIVRKEPLITISNNTAAVVEHSKLMKEGFNFQAGAGSISLLTVERIGEMMKKTGVKAGWVNGGTTSLIIDLFRENYVKKVTTCQAFDLVSVESLKKDKNHIEINIDEYANICNKGCLVNLLDIVVLGATEVDVDFNVNVNTHSDGYLKHGIGGHQDTAAGAKLTIITVPLARRDNPIIIDSVTTVTTPGECIDVIVTEGGIAVNPLRPKLAKMLKEAGLPIMDIQELKELAEKTAGKAYVKPETKERIVAVIEWRDGSVIDVVREVVPKEKK